MKGFESIILFNTDPDLEGGGGGSPPKSEGQELDPPPKSAEPSPGDSTPAETKGDADKIKALEAKLERESKARTKLEAEKSAREEAKKTELEKAQARAELETEKRKATESRLESMLRSNALRDAAAASGVRPERLAAVLKVTDSSGVTVSDDGELLGADSAIAATKKEFPEFFGSASTANVNTGGGKGGDRGNSGDEPKTDYDLGRALARSAKKKKTRL